MSLIVICENKSLAKISRFPIVKYIYIFSADTRLEEKRDALVVIEYTGNIVWIPQAIFKSSCSIDIRHFPFDVQHCKMKFGTWTYDGSKIDLELLYDNKKGFEFSDYVPSNEWTIVTTYAKKNVILYVCCPDAPFVDLTFHLEIRRQPAFYNYILILPCILLSSLTLVLFWLPPESPAKMQLGKLVDTTRQPPSKHSIRMKHLKISCQ